jgi:FkbM family methyltransferase
MPSFPFERGSVAQSLLRRSADWAGRSFDQLGSALRSVPGAILERRVNRNGEPLVFRDFVGSRFLQYPGDRIRISYCRRSVSDSMNVIKYVRGHVDPGQLCVDIGAHIGAVSVAMWSRVGRTGRVISVEPDPQIAARLRANLELNGHPTAYVAQCAVTDRRETRQLRCYPHASGWQTLGKPEFANAFDSYLLEVETVAFDDLLEGSGITRLDLVKIDAEGAEVRVLGGMTEALREKRISRVLFEVNHLMLEGLQATVEDIFSIWEALDYDLTVVDRFGTPRPFRGEWPRRVVGDCLAIART